MSNIVSLMPKQQPDYLPLSTISVTMSLIKGSLSDAKVQLDNFRVLQDSPYSLDNGPDTKRYSPSQGSEAKYHNLFKTMLQLATTFNLTKIESIQIRAIEDAAHALSEVNNEILSIAKQFKDNIRLRRIDDMDGCTRKSTKDDAELALNALLASKLKWQ